MNNTVSINNNVTVDSYEIIDDLEIIEESVKVNIVDALFTSIRPDWNTDDPESPHYIENKPTKTSEFVNDGADGTSRYAEISEISNLNRVNDVQVKTNADYESVVGNKIAKIDLSLYVEKEYKSGTNIYKVLSDNNYTDLDKNKVNSIRINGDGTLALSNDGGYKPLYNILSVNGITPDSNKNIEITPDNIEYNQDTLSNYLANLVSYISPENKSILLENSRSLLGKTVQGNNIHLISVSNVNRIEIGAGTADLRLFSASRPRVNITEYMAYLSDIDSAISDHNSSNNSHSDIRNEINTVESHMVMRMTNLEMQEVVSEGSLEDNSIVVPTDDGVYTKGDMYIFRNNSFTLLTEYQVNNVYSSSAPTEDTEGVYNQLLFDTAGGKIYRCTHSIYPFTWEDITPTSVGIINAVSNIVNNTTIISDPDGGFTAGNNYRLLDATGMIPVERIPQAVFSGIRYGGEFNGYGVITAGGETPEIDGHIIDNINKLLYRNYYFIATANYTLDGENYIPGNIALSTGYEWVKIYNSGQVLSVNGREGNVVLTYTDVGAIGTGAIVTSWSSSLSDTKLPSEKLVKESLDNKQDNLSQIQLDAVNSGITSALVTKINNSPTNTDMSGAISDHNTSENSHQDIRTYISQKATAVGYRVDSIVNTYNTRFINDNFASITFVNNLYAQKTSSNTAEFINSTPTLDNSNTLVSVDSTNTDYDWNTPEFTFIRELQVPTTIAGQNSFELNLKFTIDRNETLSFGVKIKVSIDGGTTWNYISTNQTTSSQAWETGVGNTVDLICYTDLLSNPVKYQAGTLLAFEVYKKQETSSVLTTTVYCGVEVDNAPIYTYVRFNFMNVSLNANQLEDNSVTYNKLSLDLQNMVSSIPNITSKIETHSVNYSDWYSLQGTDPYRYYTTVTLNTLLKSNTVVDILNEDLMSASQYGLGIASISGQIVTVYAITQPLVNITIKFEMYDAEIVQSSQLFAPSLNIVNDELEIIGNPGNPPGVNYEVYYEGTDEYGITVPLTLLLTTNSSYIDLTQFIFNYGTYYISAKASYGGNTSDYSSSVYWQYSGSPQTTPELRSAPQYLFSLNGDSGEYEATINNETYTFTDVSRVVDENDNTYPLDRDTAEFEIDGTTYLIDYSKAYLYDGQVPPNILVPDSSNQFIINGITYTLDTSSYPYSVTYEDDGSTIIIPYENGAFEINSTYYYLNWTAVTDGTYYYPVGYTEQGITFEMNGIEYIIQQGVGLIDSQDNLYYSGGGDFDINGNSYTLEYDTRSGYETPFSLRESTFTTTSWSDLENDGIVSINNGALSIDNQQLSSNYFYELTIPDTVTEITSGNFSGCLIHHLFFVGNIQDGDIGTDPFNNSQVLLAMVYYGGMNRTIFPVSVPPTPSEDPTMTVVFNIMNPELADNFTIDLQPDDKIVSGMGGSLTETMEVLSDGTTYYWTATTSASGNYSTQYGNFSTDPDPDEGTVGVTLQIYIDFSNE